MSKTLADQINSFLNKQFLKFHESIHKLLHIKWAGVHGAWFSINPMICGHHEWTLIWNNLIVGEEFACKRKSGNSHGLALPTLLYTCNYLAFTASATK